MKILVADGSQVVHEAMAAVVADDSGFELVQTVGRGALVLPWVARTSPDVVLLDAALPGLDGFECLLLLRERYPAVRVILLDAAADAATLVRGFALGAAGVVAKDVDAAELAGAVRDALLAGGYATPGHVTRRSRIRSARAVRVPMRTREILDDARPGRSDGHARPPAPV